MVIKCRKCRTEFCTKHYTECQKCTHKEAMSYALGMMKYKKIGVRV